MPAKASQLTAKLAMIRRVFSPETILNTRTDTKYIQKYYKANKLAYSLFHTRSGIIHMGISRDSVYKADDLLEAARIIESQASRLKAKRVLELATGRGGTSVWLAQKYPAIQFEGIELSMGQLVYAQKKARNLPNYHPVQGDYHDLSRYEDSSIDVVFVIEALCYSQDPELVLAEVRRVLRKNGVFIVLDAYAAKDRNKLSDDELLACRLTEIGMAVTEFGSHKSLIDTAKKVGFSVVSSEDVSRFILPTLRRFERMALKFFHYPKVARLITSLTSPELTYNAVSGLLMPDLVEDDLASYYISILKR